MVSSSSSSPSAWLFRYFGDITTTQRLEQMVASELRLLSWARTFDPLRCASGSGSRSETDVHDDNNNNNNGNEDACTIEQIDTWIPRSVVPLSKHGDAAATITAPSNGYRMHAIRVNDKSLSSTTAFVANNSTTATNSAALTTTASGNHHRSSSSSSSGAPLVLVHGYANAAAYFYRNFIGLARSFGTVYSVDLLGWGLSSRPPFGHLLRWQQPQQPQQQNGDNDSNSNNSNGNSTALRGDVAAEDFFVESLEAWRHEQELDRMILAGHSIGGHVSIAYAERYPTRVERLILISPAGVAYDHDTVQRWQARIQAAPWTQQLLYRGVFFLFERGYTPGWLLRCLPIKTSRNWVQRYVRGRFRDVTNPDEQDAIGEYLWLNSILPGSGEYCLNRFLTPMAMGRYPTMERIAALPVQHVSFLYGADDWMDPSAGLRTELLAAQRRKQQQQQQQQQSSSSDRRDAAPPLTAPEHVHVYSVSRAGHLLMLDHWQEFNHGMALAAGLLGSSEQQNINDDGDDDEKTTSISSSRIATSGTAGHQLPSPPPSTTMMPIRLRLQPTTTNVTDHNYKRE